VFAFGYRYRVVLLAVMLLAGCSRGVTTTTPAVDDAFAVSTSDPQLMVTIQADTGGTAAWVSTVEILPTGTAEPRPTLVPAIVAGDTPRQRTGDCQPVAGYTVHQRQGFCMVAPSSWVAWNVDGGLAAALSTTPGQAITLQPDWAQTTDVCQMTIYVRTGESATEHIERQYARFQEQPDLDRLSLIEMTLYGGMSLPGFNWQRRDGQSGLVLAGDLSTNRIVHIGLSGTICNPADLASVIESLRFTPPPL